MPRRGRISTRVPHIAASAAVFALFAGMLFWTKFKVIRDLPRSAYAEPDPEDRASVRASDRASVDDARGGGVAADAPDPDAAGEGASDGGADANDP